MFDGWLSFAGAEIINQERTHTYASRLISGLSVLDCSGCEDLHEVLGDEPYRTPFVDQPDWFDPNNPDTWNFCGLYPLSIEGVEDSTRTAATAEMTFDGGYAARPRMAGREMRFTGLLLGTDDAAVQAGMTWLKHALEGDTCRAGGGCSGDHMCYLAACPQVCEDSPNIGETVHGVRMCPNGELTPFPDMCVVPYERHMYEVTCIEGPLVTQEYDVSCGAAMWRVEFTLYAGVPGPFGTPVWVGALDENADSMLIAEDGCVPSSVTPPLQDPNCVVPVPPRPPLILDDCLVTPEEWRRFQLEIPGDLVPLWSDAVPIIRLRTYELAANQVRLRFYANPFGRQVGLGSSACDYCGEFLISYIPPNSLMTINGIERTAWVEIYDGSVANQLGRQRVPATHLLYGSGGTPMSWPLLSCGVDYSLTVDVVPDTLNRLSGSLCLASRE